MPDRRSAVPAWTCIVGAVPPRWALGLRSFYHSGDFPHFAKNILHKVHRGGVIKFGVGFIVICVAMVVLYLHIR
jgi:hypothetical protein